MLEWLKQPGFVGTHATIGADLSQTMAAVFTVLFIIGWVQARKGKSSHHHWLVLSGMVAMLAFFTSYYLFRQLGVLAFEGKEGFGGPQALYENVFVPLLTFHIVLVIIALIMAVYMIVLGFRAQVVTGGRVTTVSVPLGFKKLRLPLRFGGKRELRDQVLKTSWKRVGIIFGVMTALVLLLFLSRVAAAGFSVGKLSVYLGLLILAGMVFGIEIGIQRVWPNGEKRHRVLGTFTMVIYCVLFVTGSVTYTMLYILYPGKIG